MAYRKEIKEEILNRLQRGEKVKDIVQNFGISNATIYNWKKDITPSIEQESNHAQVVLEEVQKIKELIGREQYVEAEEVYLKSPYKEEEELVVCYTKLLWCQKRHKEIVALCEDVKYQNSIKIQENYLSCLWQLNEHNKALSICERFRGNWTAKMTYYYVKYIAKKEGIEQALTEIEESKFKNSNELVTLKIKSLVTLKQYEEALALCQANAYRNSVEILRKEIYILGILHRYPEAYQKAIESEYRNKIPIKKQIAYNLCSQYIFEGKSNVQLLKEAYSYIDVNRPFHKGVYEMLLKLVCEAGLDLETLKDGEEVSPSLMEQEDVISIENNEQKMLEEKEEVKYLIECYRLKDAKRKIERSLYSEQYTALFSKILWLEGRVEEALEIWNNPTQENEIETQTVFLEYMYSKEEYGDILKRSKELEHFKNPQVFSYYVKAIGKIEGLDKALETLELSEFSESKDVSIVALKSYLHRALGKVEEALAICENSKCREEFEMVKEEVMVLSRLKRYGRAYQKAVHCKYKDTVIMKTHAIQILCNWYCLDGKENMELLEKAKKHIVSHALQLDRKHFAAYAFLLQLTKGEKAQEKVILASPFKEKAMVYLKKENESSSIQKEVEQSEKETLTYSNSKEIANQLAFIYQGSSSLEEINALEIEEYEKDILVFAHLHKKRREEALRKVKEVKKKYDNTKQLSTFNKISAQIENKRSLFDITFYSQLLNSSVNFNALKERKEEQKESSLSIPKKEETTSIAVTKVQKKRKEAKKFISSKDLAVLTTTTKQKKNIQPKNEEVKTKETDTLIKDVFAKEILEVSAYIYTQMQSTDETRKRDAIKAWNIFENLIYKPVSDKNSLEKVKMMLYRISFSSQVSFEPLLKSMPLKGIEKVRK